MTARPRFRENLRAHFFGTQAKQFGLNKRIFVFKGGEQRAALRYTQDGIIDELPFFLRSFDHFLRRGRLQF